MGDGTARVVLQVALVAGDSPDRRIGERTAQRPQSICRVHAVRIRKHKQLAGAPLDRGVQCSGLPHARQSQQVDCIGPEALDDLLGPVLGSVARDNDLEPFRRPVKSE